MQVCTRRVRVRRLWDDIFGTSAALQPTGLHGILRPASPGCACHRAQCRASLVLTGMGDASGWHGHNPASGGTAREEIDALADQLAHMSRWCGRTPRSPVALWHRYGTPDVVRSLCRFVVLRWQLTICSAHQWRPRRPGKPVMPPSLKPTTKKCLSDAFVLVGFGRAARRTNP
jgi:hypothetical protein